MVDRDYVNRIKQYKIDNKIISEKPVYNYYRDYSTGEIKIESQKKINEVVNSDNDLRSLPMKEVKELLDKTEELLIKNMIEAKVHEKLRDANLGDGIQSIYDSKLSIYKREVEYLKMKKFVLISILNSYG